MHQIENSFLRIKARELGGELTSIFDLRNKTERLWQADASVWNWHAPVLFPVVGRCWNDEIKINEQTYKMEKHGFARRSNFRLLDLTESKMVFSLSSNQETLLSYPYRFEFLISYRLDTHRLIVSYEIINKDDKDLYFSFGGHPAFAAPVYPDEIYEDYYLEFEQPETAFRHCLNRDGFFDGNKELVMNHSNTIDLRKDIFRDDALIFKDLKSHKVALKSVKTPHYIKMEFNGFPYLGIWAKENAPYVCLEPWIGCADTENKPCHLPDKEGMTELAPGNHLTLSYTIEVG